MSRAHHKNRRRVRGHRITYGLAIDATDLPDTFKATHDYLLDRYKQHRAGPVGWRLYGPQPVHIPGYTRDELTPVADFATGLEHLSQLEEEGGSEDGLAGARLFIQEHAPAWLVIADLPVTRP